MKKRMLVVGALVLAGVVAALWWNRPAQQEAGLALHGNVDIREVELAFRQPGRVARLLVDEGSTVKAGALLAELDARPFEDALALARANRAQAQAELEKAVNGSRSQEVAQAEAGLRQAQAAQAEAERNYQRQSALAASGAASERTLEAARSAREQTRAAAAAAEQALALRREGARKEDLASARARLAASEAQLAQAQTARDDARLLAPSDGVIAARVREAGSMVSAASPVFTLSLQEPVQVRAYVSEAELTRVRPGARVTVLADGSSERFAGTVGFIAPKAEFTPKSVETTDLRTALVYRVRVNVPGAAHALRQGMPVTVLLDAEQPR